MKVHYYSTRVDRWETQVFAPSDFRFGSGKVDILIVGQSPSINRPWKRRHEVFGARSWGVARQLVEAWVSQGLVVGLTNAVKEPQASGARLPKKLLDVNATRLHRELDLLKPKWILAIGAVSARMLLGERFHGLFEDHGTIFHLPTYSIMPTFHFSAALSLEIQRFLTRDLIRFETLLRGTPPFAETEWREYEGALGVEGLHSLSTAPFAVLDIESEGLSGRITALGLRWNSTSHLILNPDPTFLRDLEARMPLIVGHNLYFDFYRLGWWNVSVQDTMLMALVCGESRLSLKHLTSLLTSLNGSHGLGGTQDPAYLAQDLLATEAIWHEFRPKMANRPIEAILNRAVPVLVRARIQGIKIRLDLLDEIGAELEGRVELLAQDLRGLGGPANLSSDAQVVEWFRSRGLDTGLSTPKGKMSVSEAALLNLSSSHPEAAPLIESLLEFRSLKKLSSGFVDNYRRLCDEEGFLHPRLLLHGARTGRLSSSDPNLQQVPRQGPIKTLFESRFSPGFIGLVDLSQAELRCAALLSNDPLLCESLLSADPHRHNASLLYRKPIEEVTAVERKKSKAITFGLLYRGSAAGLAGRTAFDIREIEEAFHLFHQRFPQLIHWLDSTEREGLAALEVTTLLGRTRELRTVLAMEGPRAVGRKAVNTPVQSLASDINLMIAIRIAELFSARQLESSLTFLIHDSILLDVKATELDEVVCCVQEAYRTFANPTLRSLSLWERLPIVGELILGSSWAKVESTNEHYDPLYVFPCSSHESN